MTTEGDVISPRSAPHLTGDIRATRRGIFWLPGTLVETENGTAQRGAAFVEWEAPAVPTGRLPIVLVHGGGGQGTEWIRTPDGRPGWAVLLVDAGHPTYVLDRPGYGRSPRDPRLLGVDAEMFGYEAARAVFGARDARPTVGWPWTTAPGGAEIDTVVASSNAILADTALTHRLERDRLVELLRMLGPSIVFTASAGSASGYLAADELPGAVAALIALEPLGPPFRHLGVRGRLDFGLTAIPMHFDPPLDGTSGADNVVGSLPHLESVPMAIVSGDASGRLADDEESVDFLRRAGVHVDHLKTWEHGLTGVGHAMAIETQSAEVLRIVLEWLDTRIHREPPIDTSSPSISPSATNE